MKTDDPRLEQAHKEMIARYEKYTDRLVTVLKYHLGIEQILDDLLKVANRRWKNRPFAGKIDIGEKLLLSDLHPHVWTVLKAGNALRNAVAHGHKEGTINNRMTELRKAYLDAVSPEQRKGIEEMADTQMVTSAFSYCGSYLVVAAERYAEKRKKK